MEVIFCIMCSQFRHCQKNAGMFQLPWDRGVDTICVHLHINRTSYTKLGILRGHFEAT